MPGAASNPPEIHGRFRRLLTPALVTIAILAGQLILVYSFRRTEFLPSPPRLNELPSPEGWRAAGDSPLDPAALDMLAPDDVLNRTYVTAGDQAPVQLFIAYYRTQSRAKNAHDPKVCLPGAGWNVLTSRAVTIQDSSGRRIDATYYVVSKDTETAVIFYWYQFYHGTSAHDYALHMSRIFNAFVGARTDVALVRVLSSADTQGVPATRITVEHFAQAIYPSLLRYFPDSP
jgi:EpsI family protein